MTEVEIPNINSEKCTLQVIEFMAAHGRNRDGDYSFHHYADSRSGLTGVGRSKQGFQPRSNSAESHGAGEMRKTGRIRLRAHASFQKSAVAGHSDVVPG